MQSEFEKTFKQHKDALTTELSKLGKQKQAQLAEWNIEQNKTDYEVYFTAGWKAAKAETHKQVSLYLFEVNQLAQATQQWHERAAEDQAVQETQQAVIDELKAQLKAVHDSRVEFVEYCRVVEAQENKG